jgi:putative SOS response-associated peptidase YedK
MCGRFTSLLSPEIIASTYGVSAPPLLETSYNVAPTQSVIAIRQRADCRREAAIVRWGLIPSWAKDSSIGNKLINARCETVAEKPSFRTAIRQRRCTVPASGFFEWAATANGKIPHYVTMNDGSPLSLAGIWESWKNSDGEITESCALLTTEANSLMATIHERMPVILHQADLDLWLDRAVTEQKGLQRLYKPYPSELMQEWPVSTFVNSPAHNSEECIHRLRS